MKMMIMILLLFLATPLIAQNGVTFSDDTAGLCERHIEIRQGIYTNGGGQREYNSSKSRAYILREADYRNAGPHNSTLSVYEEKSKRLLVVLLKEHAHYSPAVKWIDDRTLHIRLWLGRILALSVIIDIEEAAAVYCKIENHSTAQE